MSDSDLISVRDLCIGIPCKKSTTCLVGNVCFRLNSGDVLGITGQSGSGKTLTAMALAGILPRSLAVLGGSVRFMGKPVLLEKGAQKFLTPGRDVLMLCQSPARALDPWVKIGVHLTDAVKAVIKRNGTSGTIRENNPEETAVYALETAGLGAWALDRYPFELSGGQRRRCLMALALAVKPRILIADEPATGQDDVNRALVERCIRNLTKTAGTAVIVISHDLRGLQRLASELLVIYNGRQVEAGPVRDIIGNPCHAHTRELVDAMKFLEVA